MKRLASLAFLLSFSVFAADPAGLVSDFKTGIPKYGISPVSEQTFCYNQAGVQGYQVDKLQRIASVTKLITTYLATENMDLHKSFETKLYISGDKLHIAGSRDPYFEEEKILLLMDALNQLGYKSFKTVTFDKDFLFSDAALQQHLDITPAHTRSRLAAYFSSKNASFVRSKWLEANVFAKEEGVYLDKTKVPSLIVTTVTQTDINPLSKLNPIIYKHKSRPLHSILKSMNVMSKNLVAQNVFLEALKVKRFTTLMAENGVAASTFKLYNGSGLPIKTSKSRSDNLASCRTILKVIELLGKSIKKHNLNLSDIMAVNGGEDLGSFRERFLDYPETHEAVLSKTGTLMHASSLAGVLLIADNQVLFAILNHTTNVSKAKKFQDYFVTRMFHHLGSADPMDYTKISIFPWDETDFLVQSY